VSEHMTLTNQGLFKPLLTNARFVLCLSFLKNLAKDSTTVIEHLPKLPERIKATVKTLAQV